MEIEIEKRIPFKIALKKIETLGAESDKRCERHTLKTTKRCPEEF